MAYSEEHKAHLRQYWQKHKHNYKGQTTMKIDKPIHADATDYCKREGLVLQVFVSGAIHLAVTNGVEWLKEQLTKTEGTAETSE